MAGNANSGRKPKPIIDPMTGVELPAGSKIQPVVNWPIVGMGEIARLRRILLAELGKQYPTLRGARRRATLHRLVDIAGWYRTEALDLTGKTRRGRKPNSNIQSLLSDCDVLARYAELGGMWRTSWNLSEGGAVTLARIVASATGKPLPHDLRRQIGEAKKID